MDEIELEKEINEGIKKCSEIVIKTQLEKALENPKKTKLHAIKKENYILAQKLKNELQAVEDLKRNVDEYEDSLAEYFNIIKLNKENHEKYIESTKELNENYLRQINNPNLARNFNENEDLRKKLDGLIDERNELIARILEIENEDQVQEENEENNIKLHIKYLTDQLNLIS